MTKQHSIKLDVYQQRTLERKINKATKAAGRKLTGKELAKVREEFELSIKRIRRQNEALRKEVERECRNLNVYGVDIKRYLVR